MMVVSVRDIGLQCDLHTEYKLNSTSVIHSNLDFHWKKYEICEDYTDTRLTVRLWGVKTEREGPKQV